MSVNLRLGQILGLFIASLLLGCGTREGMRLPAFAHPQERVVDVANRVTLRVRGCVEPCEVHPAARNAGIVRIQFLDAAGRGLRAEGLPWSSVIKSQYVYLPGDRRNTTRVDARVSVPKGAVRAHVLISEFMKPYPVSVAGLRIWAEGVLPPIPYWSFPIPIVSIWFPLFVLLIGMSYFLVPRCAQPWVLLLGSLGFYASFNYLALPFICTSVISIWLGGILMERSRVPRLILGIVLMLNVGMLLSAKYLNWAVDGVFGLMDRNSPIVSIVLPLGISFYTLQAVSYMMDVSRGIIPTENNPFRLALYLLFFPTVMQGPISRYGQLGPQLWKPHGYSFDRMQSGLELVIWGFFKKLVIADRVALIVNPVFVTGSAIEGFAVLLGVVGYSIQIYADFSGCVDICRGISEVLGINLMNNFRHPYFATSIKDFWRRWHISLSSWLKDYVYIPLGGNRHGMFRKYLNILIVFVVSGVWHGVGVNFFIWGVLHGAFQIVDGLTAGVRERMLSFCRVDRETFSFRLGQRIWTFALVTFAWVFFRAANISEAFSVLKRLCVPNLWTCAGGSCFRHGLDAKDLNVLITSLLVLVLVSVLQERGSVRQMLARQTLWFRWGVYFLGLFSVLVFGMYGPGYNAAQFIYMQF